jgi:hypothetical protein
LSVSGRARQTDDDGREYENQQPTRAGLHDDAPSRTKIAVDHERVVDFVTRF